MYPKTHPTSDILGIVAVMGCIPCVREVRCDILGVKAVMGGILGVTAVVYLVFGL